MLDLRQNGSDDCQSIAKLASYPVIRSKVRACINRTNVSALKVGKSVNTGSPTEGKLAKELVMNPG